MLAAQNDLRHSARILSAIEHLINNGYSIDLITQNKNNRELAGFERVIVVNTWERKLIKQILIILQEFYE